MITTGDRLTALRTAVALLNLPVRLDVVHHDATSTQPAHDTVVIHGPVDLNTPAEVRVLRVVERYTDDFRWAADR